MACVWNKTHLVVCLSLVSSACGLEPVAADPECTGIEAGALVITEVHANPNGVDGDGEYIEIYNATAFPVVLEGLTLAAARSDGSSPRTHRFTGAISIDPSGFFVAGNTTDDPMPDHVDYSYGSALGNLRNSDAMLSLWCGQRLIDEVRYAETSDGRPLELDGTFEPDAERNDDPSHWCASATEETDEHPASSGSPGALNPPCESAPTGDTCIDDGSNRLVSQPSPGSVRISEWMANPTGSDADFEWVEIVFEESADLAALRLGPSSDSAGPVVDAGRCAPVAAGSHVVFGASPRAAPRVDAELRFSLGNGGPRSIVLIGDGAVLDRVDYDTTTEGIAWQRDAGGEVCLALSEEEYGPGNFGAPGQPNAPCPRVLADDECLDEGVPRKIVAPEPGAARIAEWMANPAAVANRLGEWIEIQIDETVDLNGVVLSDEAGGATRLQSDECLRVEAGTHFVFARSVDAEENGGLDAVDARLSFSLNNARESISLQVGDRLLDSVTYESAEAGIAMQVDESGRVCEAELAYGDGDLGTPGSANPPCS